MRLKSGVSSHENAASVFEYVDETPAVLRVPSITSLTPSGGLESSSTPVTIFGRAILAKLLDGRRDRWTHVDARKFQLMPKDSVLWMPRRIGAKPPSIITSFRRRERCRYAPTKQLINQSDLALAYSPGVAAACEAIVEDPLNVFRFTARGNLVGVVTNGTAVLGLGDIGPLAAKPVMEGKAVLFKKFAGIDVFDIELDQRDPLQAGGGDRRARADLRRHQPRGHQGAGVLHRRARMRKRMKIPVFHDDQHGTAIIVGAAVLNGLQVVGKDIEQVKLVVVGAGAAALACVELMLDLGLVRENIWLDRPRGRGLQGAQRADGSGKGALRAADRARTLAE